MKIHHLLIGLLTVGAPWFCLAARGQVSNPTQREKTIELAQRLLNKPSQTASLPDKLTDPFNPETLAAPAPMPGAKGTEVPQGVASDRAILREVAPSIEPSGVMMFGNERLLLFGEKKLKVGDTLTITFEGKKYLIVVAGIGQSSFKIRLNNEEITRPINSGNAP